MMKKIVMPGDERRWRWLLIAGIVVVAIVLVAGGWFFVMHSNHGSSGNSRSAVQSLQLFICPMHPTYTSERPGECPICGMNLVPVELDDPVSAAEEDDGRVPESRSQIKVTDTQRQMIGVKTSVAEIRSLTRNVRTLGTVAYDPGLAVAQREYISTLRFGDGALTKASVERLELMGMSGDQIEDLKRTRRIQKNLYLPASDGKVWIYGEIYASDISYVKVGQMARITFPGKAAPIFMGMITAIDPIINPKSRSMRIRAEVADPEGGLKPNLYVDLSIEIPLGVGLSVPNDALIWSEGKYHLFIDEGEGKLVPRMVEIGGRTRDYALITGGLKEGDIVVTSPNFLIDSESQLKATLKSMKGGKAASGHQH